MRNHDHAPVGTGLELGRPGLPVVYRSGFMELAGADGAAGEANSTEHAVLTVVVIRRACEVYTHSTQPTSVTMQVPSLSRAPQRVSLGMLVPPVERVARGNLGSLHLGVCVELLPLELDTQ